MAPANPALMKITPSTPALAPPNGVKPNFAHPHGLRSAVIIVNSVGIALMMLVYLARVYSKRFISKQKFDWADLTCFVAVLGSIAHTTLTIYNTNEGFGLHLWDIPLLKLAVTNTKLFSMVEVVYVITIYFVKISLLLLFWQFFSIDEMSRRMIIGGFVGFSIITVPYLIVAALHVSECVGTKALTVTFCQQRQISITNLVFGSLNVLTDFYVLAIPISQLRTLHISTKKKIGVMATFTTGFVASSMSIVRLGFIARDTYNKDVLHTGAFNSILGSVEMKLAIICGCLVYVPAFVKQGKSSLSAAYSYLSRSKGSSRGSSYSKSVASEEGKSSVDKVHVTASQRPYDELSLPAFATGSINSEKETTHP